MQYHEMKKNGKKWLKIRPQRSIVTSTTEHKHTRKGDKQYDKERRAVTERLCKGIKER